MKDFYFFRLTGGSAGLGVRSAIFVSGVDTPLLSNSVYFSFSSEAFNFKSRFI